MKPKRQTLSVTLLVIDDEQNLKECLSSVKFLADEIIVAVDDQTKDKSADMAKTFTDKVFLVPHLDNFHINKKKANEKATKDWILQLDSDEIVTPELGSEIKRLLAGEYFGFNTWVSPVKKFLGKRARPLSAATEAYFLPRKNLFLGRYLKNAGQYPDPVIRLFQRGKAFLPGEDVHEQMVVEGPVGWMQGELDHHATPNFQRYLLRENRYSSLAGEHLKEVGVKVNAVNTINYLFIKPLFTFISLFIRYRGFLDGFPGFVFSLYSGLHHAFSYMKLVEIVKYGKNKS